jgi:hypothetical protein
MRFDLKRPCGECPFRSDIRPYLTLPRAREIALGVAGRGGGGRGFGPGITFACHKTVTKLGAKGGIEEQMCGGALAMLAKADLLWDNQMIRIAARFHIFDPAGIDATAQVYAGPDEMIEAHKRVNR